MKIIEFIKGIVLCIIGASLLWRGMGPLDIPAPTSQPAPVQVPEELDTLAQMLELTTELQMSKSLLGIYTETDQQRAARTQAAKIEREKQQDRQRFYLLLFGTLFAALGIQALIRTFKKSS